MGGAKSSCLVKEKQRLMTTKKKIDLLIESPFLGLWRICGKETQKRFRRLNRKDSLIDRDLLLEEVLITYHNGLDNMVYMCEKERKHKKRFSLKIAR